MKHTKHIPSVVILSVLNIKMFHQMPTVQTTKSKKIFILKINLTILPFKHVQM